jgi:hypothetical protein
MIEMFDSVFSVNATAVYIATTPFLAYNSVKRESVAASTRGGSGKGGRR